MTALTRIYLDHYRELVDFLSRRTGCRHAAQDCAQDCWFKLCKARPAEPVDNLRGYVFRVAANIAVDWHRQRGREDELLADYGQLAGVADASAPDTAHLAALRQTIRRLEAIILAQPPRTVEVFLRHKVDGLSHAQVAAELGISVSAVEKHMIRLLLACQAVLDEV